MKPKIQHNEAEYDEALREVAAYFANPPKPGTEPGDRFELLLLVVQKYEAEHYAIDVPAAPIAALRFRMEQQALSPRDLVPSIGRLDWVYEILEGSRELTLAMICKLHENFGIPYESLIGGNSKAAGGAA